MTPELENPIEDADNQNAARSWSPTRPRSPKTDRTRRPMTDYGRFQVD